MAHETEHCGNPYGAGQRHPDSELSRSIERAATEHALSAADPVGDPDTYRPVVRSASEYATRARAVGPGEGPFLERRYMAIIAALGLRMIGVIAVLYSDLPSEQMVDLVELMLKVDAGLSISLVIAAAVHGLTTPTRPGASF